MSSEYRLAAANQLQLDLTVVDRVETVSNDESIETARRLTREEGILSGMSSGAATAAAIRLAQQPKLRIRRWWLYFPTRENVT
jgi:cysteine synthase